MQWWKTLRMNLLHSCSFHGNNTAHSNKVFEFKRKRKIAVFAECVIIFIIDFHFPRWASVLHSSIPGTNGKLLLCWQSFSLDWKSGDEDTVQDEEELVMPSTAVAILQRKQVSADDGECAHYIIESKAILACHPAVSTELLAGLQLPMYKLTPSSEN